MTKKITLLAVLLMLSLTSFDLMANKYAVYFTDKNNSPYSINYPEEFLSQRSIARRARFGIAVNTQDLPVNPSYVQQVTSLGATLIHTSRWLNCAIVSCTQNVANQIAGLDFVSEVVYVAPANSKEPSKFANKLDSQIKPLEKGAKTDYNYGNAYGQISQINGIPVHQQGYTGQGVLIAILDGGFNNANNVSAMSHIYNEGRLLYTQDVVNPGGSVYASNTSNHGTNVFSCIGAKLPGQMVGTAPDAEFALIRTEDGDTEYLIECYYWVVGAEAADSIGADLITSSLGYQSFDDSSMDFTHEDLDGETTPSSIGAMAAVARGIFVSVSAGNTGDQSFPWVSTPSDPTSVLCVGACTSSGSIAYFSSIGPNGAGDPKPDVLALGYNSTVITPSGNVSTASGTSFACPITSGMIACLLQANPSVTPEEVLNIVNATGNRYPVHDNAYGWGIPDYAEALQGVLAIGDLKFKGMVIHDESGNNDGYLNPGETASVDVIILNKTDNVVSDIVLSFATTDPFITLDSEPIELADFTANETRTIPNAFTVTLSEDAMPKYSAKVVGTIECNTGNIVSNLEIIAYNPYLVLYATAIINDDNGDNILDPGETADMYVYVLNEGNRPAFSMYGALSSTSDLITINTPSKLYGTIAGDNFRYSSFNITLSEDADPSTLDLPFNLALNGSNYSQNIEFSFQNTCNIIFNLHDSYGDGWNGANLIATFSDSSPSQTMTIASGSSATYTVGVSTGTTVTLTWQSGSWDSECSFEVTYEDGTQIYSISHPSSGVITSFVVSCSGGNLPVYCLAPVNIDSELGGDYITLTWEAPEDATPSYYLIFRDGVNIDLVYGTTYTDEGLDPGIYCYSIEADYSDGCRSELTEEVCVDLYITGIMGDADNNGIVNVSDLMSMVSYILESDPHPFIFSNADVNIDGVINVFDIIKTVNIIFNNGK